jgi:cysteine desulfurase/selenocysteine lyase
MSDVMAPARNAGGLRALVGDGSMVPCVDGQHRPYLNLDAAASTSALPVVARAVEDFLPCYSSVHRGAGHKSQQSTRAYEAARGAALSFAGRPPGGGDDVAIICRNTRSPFAGRRTPVSRGSCARCTC